MLTTPDQNTWGEKKHESKFFIYYKKNITQTQTEDISLAPRIPHSPIKPNRTFFSPLLTIKCY